MLLPKMFHIDIPIELSAEVSNCSDKASIEQVGTEWAIKQCKELIDKGAPVLHFYTMGKSGSTYNIAKELF